MALVIKQKDGSEVQWHVGSPKPQWYMAGVDYVYADGHELTHIEKLFNTNYNAGQTSDKLFTIPMIVHARKMVWYGDIAKTILANIF